MSLISVIGTVASIAYPPAAPAIAIIAPILEGLYANRDEIAAAVKGAMPAFEAIKAAAPQVIPHIEKLATAMLPHAGPTETHAQISRSIAAAAVQELVPGWTNAEANRWMNLQNATG